VLHGFILVNVQLLHEKHLKLKKVVKQGDEEAPETCASRRDE
jgi:hypothetical protein